MRQCCSVIQDPDVLFCDEPTSGLDSRAALRVMQQIRNYCARGVMCLTAIHQPRSAIWQGFHKVLILSKGHQLYFGPRAGAEPWFQELVHFRRDPETSVVDWLLDIVNTDFESLDEADDIKGALHNEGLSKASEAFLNSSTFLAERATWGRQATSSFLVTDHSNIPRTSGSPKAWWFQYNLLLNRAFKNALRNPSNLLTRLTCNFFVAVAAGLIFFQVARKTHSYLFDIQVLVALNMLIYGSVVTPFASISLFINDRKFFTSDNASGLYRTSAYYMAQMTVELVAAAINASLYCCVATALTGLMDLVPDPSLRLTRFFEMLGIIIFSTMVGTSIVQFFASLSPNFDVAFILCASNITFALLSGGVIVFYPTMSTVSSWMPNLSFIRYLFQALVQQMLRGTSHAAIISTLQLNTPKGVLPNLAVGAVFYVAACFGTFMCLKFLHKEKR